MRLKVHPIQVVIASACFIISGKDVVLEGLHISIDGEADKSVDAVTIISGGSCTIRMCTVKSTMGCGIVVSGASANAKVTRTIPPARCHPTPPLTPLSPLPSS
jgi:hypothetical protein